MKIAVIYDLSEPGGVQTCVISLIKGLNRIDVIPTLIWDTPPSESLLNQHGLKLYFNEKKFLFRSNFIRKFPNSLRYLLWPFNIVKSNRISKNYDFIYSFTNNFIVNNSCSHCIYLSGPPIIAELEPKSFKFKFVKYIYKIFIRYFFPVYERQPLANYVINSKYTARLLASEYRIEVPVVYPSVQFSNINSSNSNRNSTTYFSRIVPYKRPELILDLAELYPHQDFIIMGAVSHSQRGYVDLLRRVIQDRALNNIEVITNPSIEAVQKILNNSKFYIFPAMNEHFGITTVECIFHGCIPLVHNSGGQIEIVNNEKLRFTDDEFLQKYEYLNSLSREDLDSISHDLKNFAKKFTEEMFVEKMLSQIGDCSE